MCTRHAPDDTPLKTVVAYYDDLAGTYDDARFGNSYGRYIDAVERPIIARWISGAGGVGDPLRSDATCSSHAGDFPGSKRRRGPSLWTGNACD